jgi:LAO/AO transport system kinase
MKGKRFSVDEYVSGILSGDRVMLSRAITLVESELESDQLLAVEVLEKIHPHTGNSIRIGVTGVPGVGKSTFIEAFGKQITSLGKRLAVLTIDPSSQKTRGSILGDKTRMIELSHDPRAYIRPSASGTALGGVAAKTREAIFLCEAAGFDVVLVETVGVGQSETQVHSMVDFFLLLMLAGAGDELQGIKKGIMEMADGLAINKADGDNLKPAKRAKAEFQSALHLFPPSENGWYPKVLTCSALNGDGLAEIWEMITQYQVHCKSKGFFEAKRKSQNVNWMRQMLRARLEYQFYHSPKVLQALDRIEKQVENGEIPALKAARELIDLWSNKA